MDWSNTPQLIVAVTVTSYWACVLAMVLRSWARFRVSSGSLPKDRLEKRMWIIWAPTIVAWVVLSWSSHNLILKTHSENSTSFLYQTLLGCIWIAAMAALTAFVLTTRCWLSMGRNWSMAVTPGKKTQLITDGPFASVRHPIYALSLLLMLSTLVVVTNGPMLVVAAIHCTMLILKSWNEERYLTSTHGQQYLEYLQQTNRFVPTRAVWKLLFRQTT